MNPLDKTKKQLRFDEGEELKVYFCTSKKATIGVGRNLEDKGLTKEESDYLFNNDVQEVVEKLVKADQGKIDHAKNKGGDHLSFFIEQPEEIQSVLINMGFNLGVAVLLKFKKTLNFIGQRRFDIASVEMLDSKWADQVGPRALRLSKVVYECSPNSPNGNLHKAVEVENGHGKSEELKALIKLIENDTTVVVALAKNMLEKIQSVSRET